MENKLVNPLLERNYRKRYFANSPSTSPHSDRSFLKNHSLTPTHPHITKRPYSFLSKFEQEIFATMKDNNQKINSIEKKADLFMTEIEDRIINRINNKNRSSRHFTEYKPIKVQPISPKEDADPPVPSLSFHKRSMKKGEKAQGSIENLMKTSSNFKDNSRNEIIMKLQKSLGAIKSPCIEELYARISRKEHSFEVYKNIRHNQDIDPFKAFTQVCSAEHIPPIPLLTHLQDNSLVLNRYRINDTIASALSDSISLMPYLKKLHLDENSITDLGGEAILRGLLSQQQIQSFFYTSNEIGPKFANAFKSFLKSCPLLEINFRGCKVPPNILIQVIAPLRLCKTLKKIFFAEIGFSDNCIEKFGKYLKRSTIIELDLSWNSISQEGSLKFFKALKMNKFLTSLNYSWNSLGSEESDACVYLNYVLMQHPNLMHVNLSYTQLNDNNFVALAAGLQTSRTLVSVHFTGNNISQKRINTMISQLLGSTKQGLISDSANRVSHPSEAVSLKSISKNTVIHNVKFRDRTGKSVYTHRDALTNISHPSNYHDRLMSKENKEMIFTKYLGESTQKEAKNWVFSEHCWICERWVPYTLILNTSNLEVVSNVNAFKWATQILAPYKLKASFNLWEDISLENIDQNKYEFAGILPPGLHKFWVIQNNSEVCVTKNVSRRNWEGVKVNEINVNIRNYDLEPIVEIKEEVKVFDKNKSVFKKFEEDTPETRKIMFSNDKKHLKVPNFIKDEVELNAVYDVLLENFEKIKEIFDAVSAASSYPNIGGSDFHSFCDGCKLIDGDKLTRKEIEVCFKAVNYDPEDQDDNPASELCRYEFLEIIVRLAGYKYKGLNLRYSEMTKKLLDEHIFKYSDPSHAIKFRREKIYTYDVNDILAANFDSCNALFGKYRAKIGRFITLEGYKTMLKKADIKIREEEVIKVYAFSKMSIIDEMAKAEAYDEMVFVEFLESIVRLANAVYGDIESNVSDCLIKILDSLFSKNKLKRKIPEIVKDEDSEEEIE